VPLRKTFSFLFPIQATVTHREKLLSGIGGVLGIFLTAWIGHLSLGTAAIPFIVASMGASSVLLMGVPHSPLAQPWAFVGGHLISALIGVTCAKLVPGTFLAAGLAVGLSISVMHYLRCLHPPGGATALMVVVGGERLQGLGYHFLLTPLLPNLVVLLGVALLFNNLLGRRYPQNLSFPSKSAMPAPAGRPKVKLAFNEDDLIAALKDMGGFIDVTGEDLERIYTLALLHAHRGRFGDIRLKDIMTREVVTTRSSATLEDIWSLLREHRVRGVPVTDDSGRVVGMVTIADFLKTRDWRICTSLRQRLKLFLKRKSGATAEQVMTSPVISARENTHLAEAFLTFAEKGINHLPVTDEDNRLVGIVTRLDLLSAVYGDLANQAPAPGKPPTPQ
jgi:CBS domain-containing membrane protein